MKEISEGVVFGLGFGIKAIEFSELSEEQVKYIFYKKSLITRTGVRFNVTEPQGLENIAVFSNRLKRAAKKASIKAGELIRCYKAKSYKSPYIQMQIKIISATKICLK